MRSSDAMLKSRTATALYFSERFSRGIEPILWLALESGVCIRALSEKASRAQNQNRNQQPKTYRIPVAWMPEARHQIFGYAEKNTAEDDAEDAAESTQNHDHKRF